MSQHKEKRAYTMISYGYNKRVFASMLIPLMCNIYKCNGWNKSLQNKKTLL